KAIDAMGFESPSEIQEKIIPHIFDDEDVIGHAKTGTGKTAAFSLPILEKMDYDAKSIQCLVLVPTRELAKQVSEEIDRLGKYKKQLKTCVVYGGQSYQVQRKQLNKNPQVLVATPGRLIDLINQKYVKLQDVQYLILDEADEMLSIGFAQELDEIATYIPKERQTLLFSATFNDGVYKLSKKYLNKPTKVSVVSDDKVASTITQKYMLVNSNERTTALQRLLTLHRDNMVMVFANTKKEVDSVVEDLQQKGIMAEAIHGDLSQKMRENVLAKFKKGITKVLVCSDVAARGLDIKGVEVVINIDLPFEREYYVHRVGRTGRANNEGIAYTLLGKNKERKIKSLARELKTTMEKMPMIKASDVAQIEINDKLNKLEQAILNNKEDHMDKINPLLKKGYDLDSIFHGLLDLAFEGNDVIVSEAHDDEVRLFVNQGKRDGFTKRDLIGLFNLGKEQLFEIDVKPSFSFCTVRVRDVDALVKKVSKKKFKKRSVNVEIANS
ncbi:MAG: DEAD/DEAH box helicase, partial [Erysipelotrichales bacterium]